MSIADGQVVLVPGPSGAPRVDPAVSISRIGGRAYPPALATLAPQLRFELVQVCRSVIACRIWFTLGRRPVCCWECGQATKALCLSGISPNFFPLESSECVWPAAVMLQTVVLCVVYHLQRIYLRRCVPG